MMVRLVPKYSESFVSTMDSRQVMKKLDGITRWVNFLDRTEATQRESAVFNGSLKEDCFRISKKIDKADSFLPLIKGEVAPLAKGCLISLEYSFFPSTAFLLGFWGVISFALTVVFLSVIQDWKLALLSLLAGMANYGFAFWHFRRKVRESQALFHEAMGLKAGKNASW
ncbi:ABC transporter ATP-binding protein [Cyclobacterium jeungdonense]|uniref:ABC transporter ATP-binding protein n=1 Tax=Cyclobacterium jeungdonense TaxID=708087 RepID=A0ABT8C8E5_9BACT|nr:ABC transporter ATP-binding protein [Cyclobacterium jeungdonense]MDN3688083.1 ABC transporter ATP-binding protein [Cyclobacterium jeungdonense]